MGFRENLKDEMDYQDISTRELAEKSGVGKRTIDNYLMSSPQEPGVYNALKIAQALNVSVEYLVTGTEYKSPVTVTGEKLEFLSAFENLPADDRLLIVNLIKKLQHAATLV